MHSHEANSSLMALSPSDDDGEILLTNPFSLLPYEIIQNIARFLDKGTLCLLNKDFYKRWLCFELQRVNRISFEQEKLSTGAYLVSKFLTHVMRDIVFCNFDYPIPQHIIRAVKKEDPGCLDMVRPLYINTICKLVGDKPFADEVEFRGFDLQSYVQNNEGLFIPYAQKRFFKNEERENKLEENIDRLNRKEVRPYLIFELYMNNISIDDCPLLQNHQLVQRDQFASPIFFAVYVNEVFGIDRYQLLQSYQLLQKDPVITFFCTALVYQRDPKRIYNFARSLIKRKLQLHERDGLRLALKILRENKDFFSLSVIGDDLIKQQNNEHDYSHEIQLIINFYKKINLLSPYQAFLKTGFLWKFVFRAMKYDRKLLTGDVIIHALKNSVTSLMVYTGSAFLLVDLAMNLIFGSLRDDGDLLSLYVVKRLYSWISKRLMLISNKSL